MLRSKDVSRRSVALAMRHKRLVYSASGLKGERQEDEVPCLRTYKPHVLSGVTRDILQSTTVKNLRI